MGSEPVGELPEDLEAWVAERSADDDISRAEVVRRLMAAHRLLDEHPERLDEDAADLDDGVGLFDAAGSGVDDLEARVDELAGRLEELEGDLDEKITDVRERVIQVKRETDAKAPADHDHPSIHRRIDEGFGNYEEILEYLTERTETLEDGAEDRSKKLRRVANAVVDLRRRVAALEGHLAEREAVAELRQVANRRGIAEAACESCEESVHLGLLEAPACPHCESPFDGVESGGWFRSNRLTVGDRPALESGPSGPGDRDATPGPSDAADTTSADGSTADSTGSGVDIPEDDGAEEADATEGRGEAGVDGEDDRR